ncbi:hypothetical protein MMC25_000808 [Agyrium rufum]|nr:hypothetical protein [Agyrium rufum]
MTSSPICMFIFALCVLVAYRLFQLILQRRISNAKARDLGCLPPRRYPHKDPLFGLDLFFEINKSLKKGSLSVDNQHRFEQIGRTFQVNTLGTAIIRTIEPENLKAILATQFDSFGFEELRKNMSFDLWGKGILNSDGAFWAHSRALIRPMFNGAQIADFEPFRAHVDRS